MNFEPKITFEIAKLLQKSKNREKILDIFVDVISIKDFFQQFN